MKGEKEITQMSWVKFSVAVVLTSAALVLALFTAGAFMVGNAMASSIPVAAQMRGHTLDGQNLPPELAGLKDIPAAQRFSHFKGVQVSLTDQNGKPLDISVTPGVANSVSDTSLTITGNDGVNHTYSLNDQTLERGGTVATGQDVVVVTLNNTSAARAVFNASSHNWHN
jgi:hypothetical protein